MKDIEMAIKEPEVNNVEIPLLQWLEDDSEAVQFTLVQCRKKKKRNNPIRLEKNIQDGRVEEELENWAFCLQVQGGRKILSPTRSGGRGLSFLYEGVVLQLEGDKGERFGFLCERDVEG
jgi:hypothetical protein